MKLATKMPTWIIESTKDFDRYFKEQLERLHTKKIDFYLLHGLNGRVWTKVRDLRVLHWADGMMDNGYFDYLGFSFHDDIDVFKEIINAYDNWTLSQIQYNYMDVEYQAGRRGVEYAVDKGLAVVVMEPLRGGRLGKEPPDSVAKLWASAPKKRTPAEWGLLWVWNQPEIAVALSGMSAMEHVVENVMIADRSSPGILTTNDLELINQVREAYLNLGPIPCTDCGYCLLCPNRVEIPSIFRIYNDLMIYDAPRVAWFRYQGPGGLKEEQRADQRLERLNYVEVCPQSIHIPEWLKKIHKLLASEK